MVTPLPARPSLDWLRKRAKRTLLDLRRSQPATRLAQAQLAVARAHGFPSWRALKAHVDALVGRNPAGVVLPDESAVADFLRLVGTGARARVRQLLAEHPALVNAIGPHPFWGGRPQPLHVAVESGRQPMVELLLRNGADPNGSNAEYAHWSPLMLALSRKRQPLERLLRRRGARVGLAEALMQGDDRTVLRLLKPGASALRQAAPGDGSLLSFARTPAAIDRLLQLGVSTETRDRWGAAPVEVLSRLGRAARPLVRHLQARGVSATPADFARMGDRAALVAAARQDPAVLRDPAVLTGAVDFRHHTLVRWLLTQGADPNSRAAAQSGQTALHSAAWNGDLAMVKLLVAAGADPALRDRQYDGTPQGWAETAIEVTGNAKCRPVADWLGTHDGAAVGTDQPAKRDAWKPLMDAAFAGDGAAVRRLLAAGADPDVLSNSTQRHRPLHRAIERKKTSPKHAGHEEVVRQLLAAGADPRKRALVTRMTALALAASDEPRFVPLLLPRMGSLDLFAAAATLDLARVRSLIRSGADVRAVDLNTMTALHYCAASAMYGLSPRHESDQREIARALVEGGADVNALQAYAAGEWTLTALYYATGYHDNAALAEWLLDAGTNPADGESVYHAADEGHTRSLELFARRIPRDILRQQATNALTGLLRWGRVRSVPWLLAHGADPNALSAESGDAALHAAARAGAGQPTLRLLLDAGASTALKNREGKTAKQVALAAGHPNAAALL